MIFSLALAGARHCDASSFVALAMRIQLDFSLPPSAASISSGHVAVVSVGGLQALPQAESPKLTPITR